MSDQRLAHFKTMLAYERHATEAVVKSLLSVPASRRAEPGYLKALSIFGHIQQATYLWLVRMGQLQARRFEMFPAWSPEQSEADAAASHAAMERFLAGLDERGLERAVAYSSLDGTPYRSTVGEILTHVFNHATYHRGQIALLVAGAGGERARTDFIAFSRVKVG